MTSSNGLICFTNCLLPQEDGSLVEKDLWIDERRGVILDAQRMFFNQRQRPARTIDLKGNILSPGFIDIQINGAYGFDFSILDTDEAYKQGLTTVAQRIVETGTTSFVPTLITQEKSLYPKLLSLLKPLSLPKAANALGWHAEGPFLNYAKRGAHAPPFLLSAPDGTETFEGIYGEQNLAESEDWLMGGENVGVRVITAAPEVDGVMNAINDLTKRGVTFAIGHSVASSEIATAAVRHGAGLITHLFNAMPQLHHRDPSIIGLLGASPHLSSPLSPLPPVPPRRKNSSGSNKSISSITDIHQSEAIDNTITPPLSPTSPTYATNPTSPTAATPSLTAIANNLAEASKKLKLTRSELHLDKGHVADMAFVRPFYGMIVDGIHSHPNSVRLAYSSHPDGCILITDAMSVLDPSLKDGVHEWRDGRRFVKQGLRLTLEGTDTLAGSVVTLDASVRNFSRFTGCSLGEAIKCATYNPAKCLGLEHKKGTLRAGADADLVVLDRRGNVLSTWVKGQEAWAQPA